MSGIAEGTLTPIDARLADLRRMLANKFPATAQKPGGVLRTGSAGLDAAEGGLRRAALTEFSGTSGAGALFVQAMLRVICRERCFAALVDAARTFEPDSCPRSSLARLLVVLCADAMQAVKSADLLLRDGNLSLVLLDLQAAPLAQLRRIPANTWHRFQRLAEQTTAAVVVLTPQPMVEAAHVRIAGDSQWTLTAQRRWRHELIAGASWRVFPRRTAAAHPPAWERATLTAKAQNHRGDALLLLDKNDDALAAFNAALALAPGDAYVIYNRGVALLALGRKDEAKVDFTKAASAGAKQSGARKLASDALAAMK